ncbi:Vegetative incompatibility protein [Wickerhamomyces ciferrii]|uniref:Vegetative incompatibility protein n=1 Tax=Wickerhamomyces ciferrii (strain ATCC 14091 / BCRC 22168 / CBS 111 / JCM 3599 / NBRC 0793 / NRRL Y-1031 F-60-10) TaxID=1206466 RepID=K0KU20_WICCF|nr:Vegetative incompatibility protein [Wickerhamomyces ciferrii]CCH44723.1 Vegetative incompatibility protein [Wickerhamomyces ciferrii]
MSFFNKPAASAPVSNSQATEADLQNDIIVQNPPEDSISDLAFSPQADLLSVSSWDKKVRIYEVLPTGQTEGRALYEHDAPVLTTRWTLDGTKVISGGADKQVKLYDIQSGQQQQIGQHDAAVKAVRFVECGPTNTQVVVSGSWDKTLRYWDLRQPQPVSTIQLPERVYAMDAAQKLLVVGTAERHVCIIDLNNPQQISKQAMSPLKWQTRSISCYPQGNGYALGSIEGRCAFQYIDEQEQAKAGFTFKCHRQNETKAGRTESHIFSLNSIAAHPVYGTFATAGSDGCFHFWDKDAKHRLKGFPSLGGTISAANFNRNGSIYAIAVSYDWSKGHTFNTPQLPNLIRLHPTKDDEVKQKKRR